MGRIVETLEELDQNIPEYWVVESSRPFTFSINKLSTRTFKKKEKYVVPSGIFHMLRQNIPAASKLKVSNVTLEDVYRPYRGQDLTNQSLFVCRAGGIGDILFIQPILIYLKKKYPTCKIAFSARDDFQPMIKSWDGIVDVVTPYPPAFKTFVKHSYHAIFEGVIERCKESNYTNSFDLFAKWLKVDIPKEELIPRLTPEPDKLKRVRKLVAEDFGIDKFILLNWRATSQNRTPPPDFWKRLIVGLRKEVDLPIVISDDKVNKDEADKFCKEFSFPVYNFAKYSRNITDAIALASISELCITTETSMIPISAGLDVPCFSVHSAYPGHLRTSGHLADWIDTSGTDCSPCHVSVGECHRKCYDNVDIDLCVNKIKKLLELKPHEV